MKPLGEGQKENLLQVELVVFRPITNQTLTDISPPETIQTTALTLQPNHMTPSSF